MLSAGESSFNIRLSILLWKLRTAKITGFDEEGLNGTRSLQSIVGLAPLEIREYVYKVH